MWDNIKREIAGYIDKCLTRQRVKDEHQRPVGKLTPIEIPTWKQYSISMDFIMGLPLSASKTNAIRLLLIVTPRPLPGSWTVTKNDLKDCQLASQITTSVFDVLRPRSYIA